MEEPTKPADSGAPEKKSRDISDRNRLTYVTLRLQELADERSRLIEERKALVEKRKMEREKPASP